MALRYKEAKPRASVAASMAGDTSSPSKRILIVPWSSLKRQRQPCWALGWKIVNGNKEIITIAGLLPTGRNLKEYQETIEKWRSKQQQSSIDECTCLIESLHVVAFWDPNDDSDSMTKAGIKILTLQSGFPWWKEKQRWDQVLYYHMECGNGGSNVAGSTCAHFCSTHGTNNTWSLLLNQINHSHRVLRIVQDGDVPDLASNLSPTTNTDLPKCHTTPNQVSDSPPSLSEKLKGLILYNSLTFLHVRQSLANSSTTSRLLSWMAMYQCFRAWQQQIRSSPVQDIYSCDYCSKPCRIGAPSKVVESRAARLDALLSAALDALGGILVGVLLLSVWQRDVGASYLGAKLQTFQLLKDQISWLETFPAGFKLNVPLTENMGHEIRNLLHHQGRMLLTTIWNPKIGGHYGVPLLTVLAMLGGWSTFLAVAMDVWRLENWHLTLMALSFRKLYQAELYLLGALFRLFRGKKRNILRQRTDSMEYDVMQLLVGTIAFCICVFLWTTILVYYTFFVMWNFAMNLPVVILWILYAMSRSFPWGSLMYRLRHADWFPQDSYIEIENPNEHHGGVQISILRSISIPATRILSNHIALLLNRVIKWYLMSLLEVLFPRGSNASPVSLPLESLMTDFKPWYTRAREDGPGSSTTVQGKKSKTE
jgi:hypothetical protein